MTNNYALCLLFLEDESEEVLFESKWETNSKFFKIYCSMISMNKSLLLYFGRLREFLFEVIEGLFNNNTPETQRVFLFNKSDNTVIGDLLRRVDDAFIKTLAQKLLFTILHDLPRFNLIDPFVSALNKDIFKRLKLFLKKKYQKSSLSDFLKQKLKHFVVNLFLTFFFETLTSHEDFKMGQGGRD